MENNNSISLVGQESLDNFKKFADDRDHDMFFGVDGIPRNEDPYKESQLLNNHLDYAKAKLDAWAERMLSERTSFNAMTLNKAGNGLMNQLQQLPNYFDTGTPMPLTYWQHRELESIYDNYICSDSSANGYRWVLDLKHFTVDHSTDWDTVPHKMTSHMIMPGNATASAPLISIDEFNKEHAAFVKTKTGLSQKFLNAFMISSGIQIKSDQRVPTSEGPLDPEVINNMTYHDLMVNYKKVKSMPLSILSQMFIEDHRQYEIIEHSVNVAEPIKYKVFGADLNDSQKTSVISRILKSLYNSTIKQYETPEAIKYHENGGYIPRFEWKIEEDVVYYNSNMIGIARQDVQPIPIPITAYGIK